MGNYRFRLSDMMPNAWVYKLKDMARPKNHRHSSAAAATAMKKHRHSSSTSSSSSPYPTQPSKQTLNHSHSSPHPRKSYYFTRQLTPSTLRPKLFSSSSPLPQKSSLERTVRSTSTHRKVAAASAGSSCRATTLSLWTDFSSSSSDTSSSHEDSFPPEFRSDRILATESFDDMLSWSKSRNSNYNYDTVIEVDKKSLTRKPEKEVLVFDKILPPIITKQENFDEHSDQNTKNTKETNKPMNPNRTYTQRRNPGRVGSSKRHTVNSPGVRLRVNSPRIGNRRFVGRKSVSRKSISESLAIVKASFDPGRDFRESMVEMIVENNIRASKDLEELLACYLCLNSDEYHDLIIHVFKQIWFDLTDPAKLK